MSNKAHLLGQVWKAVRQLNPHNVVEEAEKPIRLAVVGPAELIQDAAAFLVGEQADAYDRVGESLLLVTTPPDPGAFSLLPKCDVVLLAEEHREVLPRVPAERVFRFSSKEDLPTFVKQVLKRQPLNYAHLPLARAFPAFRSEAAVQTIQTVSIENALFVTSTSLGNIIPNPLQPLASVAEGLGDLVALTANQIRMVFRLAAIHQRGVGFKEQAPEVLSVFGAAFGWRSIARELVSKIPFGGGVVPKAAIAFAGTWAVGESVSYFYTTGRKMTNEEMRQRFDQAMSKGRAWAEQFVGKLKFADEAVTRFKEAYSKGADRATQKPAEQPDAEGAGTQPPLNVP